MNLQLHNGVILRSPLSVPASKKDFMQINPLSLKKPSQPPDTLKTHLPKHSPFGMKLTTSTEFFNSPFTHSNIAQTASGLSNV